MSGGGHNHHSNPAALIVLLLFMACVIGINLLAGSWHTAHESSIGLIKF